MAAHPSCTWNRCRIVFRGEGRRRRRRRRIVYRKGIYRGFEVCPRGAQRRRGRINGTGREDFHRRWTRDRISIVSRAKGKNIVNVPPKKEIYFRPIFFSFSLLFLFRERERERDVRILSTSLFTKETIRANNFYPTRAVRK